MKEVLRGYYNQMRICYKHCASHSNMEKLWCIGPNGLNEILTQMGVMGDGLLQQASLGIEFEKVVFTKEKNVHNNKGFLIRYEFMEMMVRLSGELFISANSPTKMFEQDQWHEAVKYFFETYANKFFEQFHNHPWRINKFWNEENDYIFKQHKTIVDNVWSQYSGKKKLPGHKPWMSLEELRTLINDSGIDKDITERDIALIFNQSMMTVVDELHKNKIFEMNYVEY